MPAPSFEPANRKRRVGPVTLPDEGRQGPPPPWPLSGRQSAPEREMWTQVWKTPQAVMWERYGWTRTVARYCRIAVAAEARDATAAVMAQATALEDRLGLTPKSMRLLLWQVDSTNPAQVVPMAAAQGARRRVLAVDDESAS